MSTNIHPLSHQSTITREELYALFVTFSAALMIHDPKTSDEKIRSALDFINGLANVLNGHPPSDQVISMREIVNFTNANKLEDCGRIVKELAERNKTAADTGSQSFSA